MKVITERIVRTTLYIYVSILTFNWMYSDPIEYNIRCKKKTTNKQTKTNEYPPPNPNPKKEKQTNKKHGILEIEFRTLCCILF